ncbi:MAG: family 20 glycosylhydrolase [bacterium]
MKTIIKLITCCMVIIMGCAAPKKGMVGPNKQEPWRALHLLGYYQDENLADFEKTIPGLAEKGINVLVLEVDYHFQYASHPELRQEDKQITVQGAKRFADFCRKHDIRLVIEFQCFGHQSWAEETYPLLIQYPEFDVTPDAFPNNENIYCREWNPYNPKVHKIIFELIDELIDAFSADAIHVGMDEVFLINNENSVIKDKDPAEVYAKVVNDFYHHLVEKREVEMLMWGDRLIDGNQYDYGEWESSLNGTAGAVDMIPNDIIICDWHYEIRETYPSIEMFIEKGFRVLPTSFRDVEACTRLIKYSQKFNNPKVLGHLFTSWSRLEEPLEYPPLKKCIRLVNN